MKNEQVYQEYETHCRQIFEVCQSKAEDKLQTEKYKIYERIIKGMDLLCRSVRKKQEEDSAYLIKYIQISLLRSFIGVNQYIYRISAHNKDYFLDKEAKSVMVDLSELFESYAMARTTLYEYVKSKRMSIPESQIDYLIGEQAFSMNRLIGKHFRFWLRDIDQREALLTLKTEEYFLIKWGGHWEKSELLLVGDKREKSQELFEETHQGNHIDTLDFSKFFHVWDKCKFDDLIVTEKSLLFQSFREAGFSRCVFGGTTLWGSNFKKAECRRSVFLGSNLGRCSFQYGVLGETHFLNCDLSESDFRHADFREVSFEGSNLKGALFQRTDVPFLHLDNRQLQEITMVAKEAEGCILL